jgi:NCAIR mutase (PurE)-related protein
MEAQQLKKLLEQVKNGEISIDQAIEELRHLPFEDLGFAQIDHHRQIRRGFPEVIYCPGKTTEQIIKIFENLAERGNNVLATRAEEQVFEALTKTKKFPQVRYEKSAKAIVLEQKKITPSEAVIPIVTAGTADLPVAAEAKVTAEIMGQRAEVICDVGVAGLHRLFGHLQKLQGANVVIVVAGMEGALASVVGGLVSCPVIAVPTSIGSGANFGGLSE